MSAGWRGGYDVCGECLGRRQSFTDESSLLSAVLCCDPNFIFKSSDNNKNIRRAAFSEQGISLVRS